MGPYRTGVVYTTTGTVVAMKYIESIGLNADTEEATYNKLRGDSILLIRTTSGAEYVVTAESTKKHLPDTAGELSNELLQKILNKWIWEFKS
jgi:DNA-binding transcriptional regulator YhcF (GntR family)